VAAWIRASASSAGRVNMDSWLPGTRRWTPPDPAARTRRADLRLRRPAARAGCHPGRAAGWHGHGGVAKFKWPERLELVTELPVTKMGKLDKKALRDMLAGRSTA